VVEHLTSIVEFWCRAAIVVRLHNYLQSYVGCNCIRRIDHWTFTCKASLNIPAT
jgi:hypothetical protein